ncbi:MAG: efflux RND transporter periplasmic adaptor subunit [Chloroflexi bacterium]|nr:MAG: efflux RND transporter periplasmic adaptor subunit [Chloroflexota bacterium]
MAVLVAVTATGGVVAASSPRQATPAAQQPPANTAKVEMGKLAAMISMDGTLTYRARSDGSPYSVINRRSGIYTELPEDGDKVDCGGVLYRVDGQPVLLLCGSTPAYRSLWGGDGGPDVAELNANLVELGYATRAQLDPSTDYFSFETAVALEKLQTKLGDAQTGALDLGQAVFLPESVRIAKVTGELGGSAMPGAPVLYATSDTPEVQVALDPSYQGEVVAGAPAQITLPGHTSVTGKVDRLGRVAQVPAGQNNDAAQATIPAFISLDDPGKASGLDMAPVRVEITIGGVENALSVPVTALVGKAGGGFAVEVVGNGGRRELVAVKLGLFDTAGGRVQVEGGLHEGDQVVVPSP